MVAPVSSEFIDGVEIRHHWECDSCGHASSISIPLTRASLNRPEVERADCFQTPKPKNFSAYATAKKGYLILDALGAEMFPIGALKSVLAR
jgi:hypothetical protein